MQVSERAPVLQRGDVRLAIVRMDAGHQNRGRRRCDLLTVDAKGSSEYSENWHVRHAETPLSIGLSGLELTPLAKKRRGRSWYTPATLAKRLNVSERTVRNWVSSGKLPSYKIGRMRRIDPDDVDAFMAQFRQEGPRRQ